MAANRTLPTWHAALPALLLLLLLLIASAAAELDHFPGKDDGYECMPAGSCIAQYSKTGTTCATMFGGTCFLNGGCSPSPPSRSSFSVTTFSRTCVWGFEQVDYSAPHDSSEGGLLHAQACCTKVGASASSRCVSTDDNDACPSSHSKKIKRASPAKEGDKSLFICCPSNADITDSGVPIQRSSTSNSDGSPTGVIVAVVVVAVVVLAVGGFLFYRHKNGLPLNPFASSSSSSSLYSAIP